MAMLCSSVVGCSPAVRGCVVCMLLTLYSICFIYAISSETADPAGKDKKTPLFEIEQRVFLHAIRAYLEVDVNAGGPVDTSGIPLPGDFLPTRHAVTLLHI